MSVRPWILLGKGFDPFGNLALEECLMEGIPAESILMYLWQNEKTVVVGRNQDAYTECDIEALERDGGKLARRASGGGAVFHDLGNLNFTFIASSTCYDVSRQLGVILHAVRQLGIDARTSGRNDLTVAGQKFSGNAFHKTNRACVHHGTLMVNVDASRLPLYLRVNAAKLRSKGVASVCARVVNLADLCPSITIPLLSRQLVESFGEVFGACPVPYPEHAIDGEAVRRLRDKYASDAWRLGRCVPYTHVFSQHFVWGGVELRFYVEEGRIADLVLYTDALHETLMDSINGRLKDCTFAADTLCKALAGDEEELCDIRTLLRFEFEKINTLK